MSIYKDLLFLHGYLLDIPAVADSEVQVSGPAPTRESRGAAARGSDQETMSAIGDVAMATGGCP
ncbi:hypothetical protein [Marilutibacter maris]|uniref:hypothetical protein n=1 Tax=Marilutibacter maris TaxID=1605891 RepID=UPI000DA88792|nr:hypothetical protein [Lysobacter maris]